MKFTRVAYGMIVGAIYKPDSRPGASSRPVGFRDPGNLDTWQKGENR